MSELSRRAFLVHTSAGMAGAIVLPLDPTDRAGAVAALPVTLAPTALLQGCRRMVALI